jgi:hypothetical protein
MPDTGMAILVKLKFGSTIYMLQDAGVLNMIAGRVMFISTVDVLPVTGFRMPV